MAYPKSLTYQDFLAPFLMSVMDRRASLAKNIRKTRDAVWDGVEHR